MLISAEGNQKVRFKMYVFSTHKYTQKKKHAFNFRTTEIQRGFRVIIKYTY